MQTDSANPSTIEEVQAAIEKWLNARYKQPRTPRALSLKSTGAGIDVFISPSARHDLKIELVDRLLLLEVKHTRLNLNLEKFLVRSAYAGEKLRLKIERDQAVEHRLLGSALKDFRSTKYPAFYARILRAIKELESDLPSALIDEATAAPTDKLVMLEALSSAPWVAELAAEDPILAAKFRGLEARRDMLKKAGGVLSSERAAKLLSISRQAVDKRRAGSQLLALTQGRRGYSYPTFQFQDGKTLDGLEAVLRTLSAIDPWMQLRFFTNPHERLGNRTPIEALESGAVDDVVRIASAYGEQGAM